MYNNSRNKTLIHTAYHTISAESHSPKQSCRNGKEERPFISLWKNKTNRIKFNIFRSFQRHIVCRCCFILFALTCHIQMGSLCKQRVETACKTTIEKIATRTLSVKYFNCTSHKVKWNPQQHMKLDRLTLLIFQVFHNIHYFSCRIQLHIYDKIVRFLFFLHSFTFFFDDCFWLFRCCCYLLLLLLLQLMLQSVDTVVFVFICPFLARIWFHCLSMISNFWYSVCRVTNNHSQIFTLINGVYVISLFCSFILVFVSTAKSISIASQAATLFDKTGNRNKIKK